MKRLLNCLLLALLCLGCSSSQTHKPAVLRVNIQGDLASLHPFTGIDLNCRSLQMALFEGLTRIGPDGKVQMAAAEHVAISPSQTTYIFTLRPHTWSNGESVVASQFAEGWKRGMMPGSDCLRADLFYPIKNAEKIKKGKLPLETAGVYAPDEHTLIVELEHPAPYFLELVANTLYFPQYDTKTTPEVFNGPFVIAQWIHDRQMQLEKNPRYWDADHVSLDGIQISFVQDPHTALLMYEKGAVDLVGNPFSFLPLDTLERIDEQHTLHCQPVSGVFWLCCNTQEYPLSSPKIRKALSCALDREALATHLLHGETPALSPIPLSMDLACNLDSPAEDADSARAYFAQGLEELELTRETFPTLRYSYSDVADQKKIAEAIKSRWEKVLGIRVELIGSDWNVFFSNLGERQFQIGGCIWFSLYNDPIYNLSFFRELSHRYNSPGWENARYRALLDAANDETNPHKRRELLCQAQQILLDEMPIIPLYVVNYKNLIADHVENLYISDLGMIDFKWTSLTKSEDSLASREDVLPGPS